MTTQEERFEQRLEEEEMEQYLLNLEEEDTGDLCPEGEFDLSEAPQCCGELYISERCQWCTFSPKIPFSTRMTMGMSR